MAITEEFAKSTKHDPIPGVGVVVIGRNEGARLARCLESVLMSTRTVVYVDSGSTDGSAALARRLGVAVVDLDMSAPFCAARARNAGYDRLTTLEPQLRFVQFIDGDCEIVGNWFAVAFDVFQHQPKLAIVAGWMRERDPQASIFNRLGDVEWNFTGSGEVESVGGVFMIRRDAFDEVGGFDPSIAAGEEPELCQRLRRRIWRIVRIDHDMALHDLAMTRFSQWWRRQVRFGHGSMDVATRFDLARFHRSNARARLWSAWLGTIVLAGFSSIIFPPNELFALMGAAFLGLWPLQIVRIALRTWRRGQPMDLSAAYGLFLMLGFWPQMIGQLMYWNDRVRKRSFRLIEHKTIGNSKRIN